jgi:hypothetical protein
MYLIVEVMVNWGQILCSLGGPDLALKLLVGIFPPVSLIFDAAQRLPSSAILRAGQ